jgi:hypothetical protein
MDEKKAKALANLLGGETWDSGGDIYLVLVKRKDGKVVAFSDETVCLYADEDALESGEPEANIDLL